MNARSLTRQSSIGTIKSKSIINEKLSYLKPIRANVSLLRSVITNKKIKISSCNASKILKTSEEAETDFKTKSVNVSPALNENSIETHLNFIEYLSTQSLNQKLEEKLKEIDKQDYKSIFNAYFAIFDLVIVADKNFGFLLNKIKDGLIINQEKIFNEKIFKLSGQIVKYKENIENSKADKENFITKLNRLSSENIDLMNMNENLIHKYKCLEETIKKFANTKSEPVSLIEELQAKSEKINKLSVKLDEMYKNEAKILQIVDTLKMQGIKFEDIYEDTQIKKTINQKKLKKALPLLRISTLESDSGKLT